MERGVRTDSGLLPTSLASIANPIGTIPSAAMPETFNQFIGEADAIERAV
jgi:hypothetical protein